jgi:hypothetical protein
MPKRKRSAIDAIFLTEKGPIQAATLDETIAARPTAAFDAKWGQFLITPALFTKLVYEGV